MKNLISVFMIVLMVSFSTNFARANGGDGAVECSDCEDPVFAAIARPAALALLLVRLLILQSVITPSFFILDPRRAIAARPGLSQNIAQTYFLYVFANLYRYQLYQYLAHMSTYQPHVASASKSETKTWSTAAPQTTVAQTFTNNSAEEDVKSAVKEALNNPTLTRTLSQYATPVARSATSKALNNHAGQINYAVKEVAENSNLSAFAN